MDNFLRRHNAESLTFEEKLQIDQDVVNFIKRSTKIVPRNRAEDAIYNDAYESVTPKYRPPTPVISRIARLETPRLGELSSGPLPTFTELQSTHPLLPVDVCSVPEPEIDVSAFLDVKFQLPAHELEPVRNLIKFIQTNPTAHVNTWLDPLRAPSPPLSRTRSPSPFEPMFSRLERPGNGQPPPPPPNVPHSIADLPGASLPAMPAEEKFEGHISNMVAIDGWHTLQSSPSPLSTPSTSQENDRLDELFESTPPTSDPHTCFELMDPVLFPRTERLDGKETPRKPLGNDKGLRAFIMPLISAREDEATKGDKDFGAPEPALASPCKSLSLVDAESFSLVGAPPSPVGRKDRLRRLLGDEELSLDIGNIYAKTKEHPADLIMKDRPDDKMNLLMDVPELSPPNVHPANDLVVPQKFTQLLPPSKGDKQTKTAHEFLRRAKGLPSLNTSLSWMLFKSDALLPTRDEACGVAALFDVDQFEGTSLQAMNARVQDLFNKACILGGPLIGEDIWDDADHPAITHQDENLWRGDIILTREERWRRAGYVPTTEDTGEEDAPSAALDEESARSAKRVRTGSESAASLDATDTVKEPTIDDSGIMLLDDDSPAFALNTQPVNENVPTDSTTMWSATANDDDPGDPMRDEDSFADRPTADFGTMFYVAEDDPFAAAGLDCFPDNELPYNYDNERYTDKENMPPHAVPATYTAAAAGSLNSPIVNALQLTFEPSAQHPTEDESQQSLLAPETDYVEETHFVPLSFETVQPSSARQSQLRTRQSTFHATQPDAPAFFPREGILDPSSSSTARRIVETTRPTSINRDFVEAADIEIANRSLGILDFARLRAKKVAPPVPPSPLVLSLPGTPEKPREPPSDIYDQNTLRLPTSWTIPATVHRYLACMDCVQKQALMRGLRSQECAVDIVERDDLGGVDLILDARTCVLFVSLLSLPANRADVASRIAAQTWDYDRLLVILEAYPAAYARKIDRRSAAPFAYTKPVVDALRKLRRDLNIAEACGTQREAAEVRFAFADTVSEAALFVRLFGNEAERRDEGGSALWAGREWLDDEPYEGEADVAAVKGMNAFAAAVMLCQMSLQEILNMTPEQRSESFAPFVGQERVASFNAELLERRQEVETSSELLPPVD